VWNFVGWRATCEVFFRLWQAAGVAPLAGCSTRESTNNRLPAGGRGLRTTSIRAEPRADGKRVATAAQQRAAEAIATA